MLNIDLPLSEVTASIPGLILLGAAIGFLTGMFGVGGGFLLTPLLKILFKIPYPIAVGSSLLQIFLTSIISSWKHWRKKNLDLILGILTAIGAMIGSEIGIKIMGLLGEGKTIMLNNQPLSLLDLIMSVLYIVLMTAVALSIWKETAKNSAGDEVSTTLSQEIKRIKLPPLINFQVSKIYNLSLWVPFILSFGVGILTGLLGVGGGFVTLPLLIYCLGVPTHIAVGTSTFQVLFAAGYGALRHAAQGHVELLLVILPFIGSLIGVHLGVHLSTKFNSRNIRRYFAFIILIGIIIILFDLLREVVL